MMTECRGPKGRWKLTGELRGKILLMVLREVMKATARKSWG